MIATLLSVIPTLLAPAAPTIEWNAPPAFVQGREYRVEILLTAEKEGTTIPSWLLTPSAFEVNGKPVAPRPEGTIDLPAAAVLMLVFDLGPYLEVPGSFALAYAPAIAGDEPRKITALRPAAVELDFMKVPVETLASYVVLMETVQGDLLFEVWSDVAPNHVRNFLDLNHRGFYENIPFHRVSPVFMVQAGDAGQRLGDPPRWTGGKVTRSVDAEFSDRKHERGVLSAARLGSDIHSATSQFFVMVRANSRLDGAYTAYGKLLAGEDTLDRIANAKGRMGSDRTITPDPPQLIVRTSVLLPY